MLSDVEMAIIAAVVIAAAVLFVAIIMLRNLLIRYERFRQESILVMTSLIENINSINERLVAAGYPPRQLGVPTTYPQWVAPRPGQPPASPGRV